MIQINNPEQLLSFWHQVEFFIPFNLDERLDKNCRFLGRPDLHISSNTGEFWNWPAPRNKKLTGFTLYLGLFLIEEANQFFEKFFSEKLSEQDLEENVQRLRETKGTRSCFASIQLDHKGRPLWDKVSISTLPWALGQLITRRNPGSLSFHHYEEAEALLKLHLENIRDGRQQIKEEDDIPPLRPDEILSLVEALYQWAGFKPAKLPQEHQLIAIRPNFGEHGRQKNDNDEKTVPEIDIDILNSFFGKDIGRVLKALRQGNPLGALDAYLHPLQEQERINLYDDRGRQELFSSLQPEKLPSGRWPSENHHHLSLMQQFAVNAAFEYFDTQSGKLFSVNGPPGTGKTTLLRDFIAEILTRRARQLARLDQPDDAFSGEQLLTLSNGESKSLKRLKPELTGHEIVVVSYNNKAVENISRDLPRSDSLGQGNWRNTEGQPSIEYMRPIAWNIAARKSDGSYKKLSVDETPWGLIAGILGRAAHRHAFKESLFFQCGNKEDKPPANFSPEQQQSFWIWRKQYRAGGGCSFAEAKQRFLALDAQVRKRCRQRELWFHAYRLGEEINQHHGQLEKLNQEKLLIKELRPSFWARWFTAKGREQNRAYRKALIRNRDAYRQTFSLLEHAQQALAEIEREAGGSAALQALETQLPPLKIPQPLSQLDDNLWQIEGLWPDTELNRMRSELFHAALVLHESWIAWANWNDNLFCIPALLDRPRAFSREDARLLWQSLFMMVPVVSSTLASVGRQFQSLEDGDLGWVFIDEAGQAPPQTATGMLWRTQRAVIVGDPLQIEPVFTVPLNIVRRLAEHNNIRESDQVSPHQTSVQVMGDAANPLGAYMNFADHSQWLGSPLRVHRRCLAPMFDIANTIAYNRKMIQATAASDTQEQFNGVDIGSSSWIDITGELSGRHTVPEQVVLVVQALKQWTDIGKTLPPLFIITPFREIRDALRQQLLKEQLLQTWINDHVGTIHTFQGKEEQIVWMVLGCGEQAMGAAQWAASKPNLLNVALTRARKRFFIIGDKNTWGGLDNFSTAANMLPSISPQQFLSRFISSS